MDTYKLRFTILQHEMLRFLYLNAGESFTQRGMAIALDVSPTAISKSLEAPKKAALITVKKDPLSKRLSIAMDRNNPESYRRKRIENLDMLYSSGLVDHLSDQFPGTTIILFGSYSRGEDTTSSDIDIAIIGSKGKELKLERFERMLEREINLEAYPALDSIGKDLRMNLFNGIVLEGAL